MKRLLANSTILAICIFTNSNAALADDPNLWKIECIQGNFAGVSVNQLTDIAKVANELKLSRTELKLIQHVMELLNFSCDSINETVWNSIKDDRAAEIGKTKASFDLIYQRFLKLNATTITCYKAGITRAVSGKKPVCPKGYRKV